MAVTSAWYGIPIRNIFNGVANANWDWDADTIKCALTTSSYVPDRDTHDFFNDVTNEISGTGYSAGGDTLVTTTATYDTASDQVRIDSDDAQWTSASFTARIAVVYKDSAGASSTDPLIIFVDFGGDETVASGTFTIQWDSTGIGYADVS